MQSQVDYVIVITSILNHFDTIYFENIRNSKQQQSNDASESIRCINLHIHETNEFVWHEFQCIRWFGQTIGFWHRVLHFDSKEQIKRTSHTKKQHHFLMCVFWSRIINSNMRFVAFISQLTVSLIQMRRSNKIFAHRYDHQIILYRIHYSTKIHKIFYQNISIPRERVSLS